MFAAVRADALGEFRIDSLGPGAYRVYAWKELEGAAYLNAEFMETYDALGVAVSAEEGESITLSLVDTSRERHR
jgi:hypothetical protein